MIKATPTKIYTKYRRKKIIISTYVVGSLMHCPSHAHNAVYVKS